MPLDPTTPSFKAPPGLSSSVSSIQSTSLNSSESSWTGIGSHSSYLSSSTRSDRDLPPHFTQPHPPSGRFNRPPLHAGEAIGKPFPTYNDWATKSTSTPPPFGGARAPAEDRDRLDVTPQAPSRTRSPSVPILPSQSTPTSARIASSNFSFDPFSSALDDVLPSSGRASSTANDAYTGGILVHHKSTPNLGARPVHRRANASVRFLDQDTSEEEAESEQQSEESWGSGRLMGSRSLGSLQGLGRMRNVYIPKLTITEEQLRASASHFGTVKSIKIGSGEYQFLNANTHAFVLFELPEEAADFIVWLKKNNIACEYAKEDWQTEYKAREDPNSTNLYVVGLPINVDEQRIHQLFHTYGVIKSLKLLSDTEGNRRGPILVRMESRPQADRAIRGLNGLIYPGALEKLQVRIADSDQQKNYKHNLRSQSSLSSVGASLDHSRANSQPSLPLTPTQEQELQERRFHLLQLLSQIDDQLSGTATGINTFSTPRRFPSGSSPFPSPHTPSSPPAGDYPFHHRYTSSTFSDMPPTPTSTTSSAYAWEPLPASAFTHRTIGSQGPFESTVPSLKSSWQSSTSLNSSLSASTSTSVSSGGAVNLHPAPSRGLSYGGPSRMEAGNALHHARSTPEFGRSSGSASTLRAAPSHTHEQGEQWAKTLWPEHGPQ